MSQLPGRVIAHAADVLVGGVHYRRDVRRVVGCQGGHEDIVVIDGAWVPVVQHDGAWIARVGR